MKNVTADLGIFLVIYNIFSNSQEDESLFQTMNKNKTKSSQSTFHTHCCDRDDCNPQYHQGTARIQ
jgi:hypothetical protein